MSASGELQILTILQQVLAHLQRNDFKEAERLLEFALAREEDNCDTLHLFGQMRRVQNRFAEAEVFYRKALGSRPGTGGTPLSCWPTDGFDGPLLMRRWKVSPRPSA